MLLKKIIEWCGILLLVVLSFSAIKAQESIQRKGYTLILKSNYDQLDPGLKKRMIETFFIVYPKLAKEYNPTTQKEVTFFVDTTYKGVAATSSGTVVFSSAWMKMHPEDIDVITHEVMHIVQNYGMSTGPGWLTEGIADYARYKYGVDNAGAKWILPALLSNHNYKNSYRITARFFVWLENKVKKGTIKKMDKCLRNHTYTEETWKDLTGKNLEELWLQYKNNSSIN